MKIQNSPTVAVLTYNTLPPYEKGIRMIEGTEVLFLPETFNPKGPESVLPTDQNWLELLAYKDCLRRVIIFAGKKSSGALEIIELACTSLKKECLYFVICPCEEEEKILLLKQHGIEETQYVCFQDGKIPCREGPLLKGYMLEYLHYLNQQQS